MTSKLFQAESLALKRLESAAAGALLLNGNYDVWQRIEAAAQTCTTTFSILTSFGPDRLFTLPVGASVTIQRSTTVPNALSLFSGAIVGAASVTTVDHGQRIMARQRHRYKRPLVFSCYVRNESGGAFTPNLRVGTPGTVDVFGTVTNRLDQALQSCPDATWTQVYAIFDPSAYTNIDNGLEICLRIPSGSLTAGKTVRLSQFDLRESIIAPMTYISPDPEMVQLLCNQYYWKTFPVGTAPAQNVASSTNTLSMLAPDTTSYHTQTITTFPIRMVKAPTITTFNPRAANSGWSDESAGPAADASVPAAIAASGTGGFTVYGSSGTPVAAHILAIHATANAELS